MPQINRGGKFIFGRSLVRDDLAIAFPPQAVEEYDIAREGRVYLFTGSRSTGGFCVTRRGLLESSKLAHILADLPQLRDCSVPRLCFLRYKGRRYCWTDISSSGSIALTAGAAGELELRAGMTLLSIRSSDIAFTVGAYGPLVERSYEYRGVIETY